MGQYFSNEKLPSNVKKHKEFILGVEYSFFTDNGVFSKDGLDFGSRFLLECIPIEEVGANILDVGCGYGVLGIVLNKMTNASVDMVDVNLRAMHLASRNISENHCKNIRVFESNCYSNVTSKYSCIVTNPPIRAGKKIVYEILMGASNYLEKNGALFLVIRKEQGAKSLISDLKKIYNVEVLGRKKGFFIIRCVLN
ncbi:MAG: class I SAM-dependent methyltransferase [Bacilli bacterium]|nr:class I SAM-dependent methyltransferase [Bacilli bacterium]